MLKLTKLFWARNPHMGMAISMPYLSLELWVFDFKLEPTKYLKLYTNVFKIGTLKPLVHYLDLPLHKIRFFLVMNGEDITTTITILPDILELITRKNL